VLDHDDMAEVVGAQLGPGSGLSLTSTADSDHVLSLAIQAVQAIPSGPTPHRGERIQARIVTNGVDTFLLDLDGRFEYRDIDWDPAGQREILTVLAMLAQAYLAGAGHEGERRGVFGRRHSELTLELDGATYVFRGARR
jgi:hypothetical protein